MRYVEINGPTAVISVTGNFDMVTSLQVSEELNVAFNNGCTKVLVDFENTIFIDSAAIGGLIRARRRVGAENFAVLNVKGEVLKSFNGYRLMGWLKNPREVK